MVQQKILENKSKEFLADENKKQKKPRNDFHKIYNDQRVDVETVKFDCVDSPKDFCYNRKSTNSQNIPAFTSSSKLIKDFSIPLEPLTVIQTSSMSEEPGEESDEEKDAKIMNTPNKNESSYILMPAQQDDVPEIFEQNS